MIRYITTILQFGEQGEKTGWTYIEVPADIADKLMPGNKKSFRVKGKLDRFAITGIALLPMGGGRFIMPLNAAIRKGIHKKKGSMLEVQLQVDHKPYEINADLMDCLKDEPAALKHFQSLARGHRNYFSKWIESAKTSQTKAKRIALAVNALAKGWGYPEMLRAARQEKEG
jgi:hypothetical protein